MIVLMALLMSRLTHMFSNYTLSDFMSSGKWADRMGCLVKWIPWLMAVTTISWGLMNVINVAWVFLLPDSWCKQRWTQQAEVAVRNCRYWNRRSGGCASVAIPEDDTQQDSTQNLFRCNGGQYLNDFKFLKFIPKVESGSSVSSDCSFSKPSICAAYSQLMKNLEEDVFETVSDLQACLGNNVKPLEELIEIDNHSDLYRYIQLYCILWSVVWVILILMFYYFKAVSFFDAMFFQAYEESENIIARILKPLTPWSR
ncbi:hypothetical protein IE077_003152 [Cardiosporidium cionae]|uniref:Uncharacterized protein n=1 Tax=Cardiosporidium cionae TaxID=476202 RepID=A0ABQ7JF74_9APIC|nr:hypothetical protein IE077_003152 [Cardiosporidium cionae]|eukprot:KAF8822683.1 hypothetical protein IE077_003152 [Cardiosporidium cionae]